jgi:hypothetical protein
MNFEVKFFEKAIKIRIKTLEEFKVLLTDDDVNNNKVTV